MPSVPQHAENGCQRKTGLPHAESTVARRPTNAVISIASSRIAAKKRSLVVCKPVVEVVNRA